MHPWVSMLFEVIKVGTKLRIFGEYPALKVFSSFIMDKRAEDKIIQNRALASEKLDKRLALGANVERQDFLSYIL